MECRTRGKMVMVEMVMGCWKYAVTGGKKHFGEEEDKDLVG
jgi:hypothetical protein